MNNKESTFQRIFGNYDPIIFYITAFLTLMIVSFGCFFPEKLDYYCNTIKNFITFNYGWYFVLVTASYIIIGFLVAASRYGNMILGKHDDKPEFSTITWIAMLFSCGIGVGYVLWGAAEPLFHFMNTPYDAMPGTKEALPVSIRIATMHWGFHSWMGYSIVGLCIAFPALRLGKPMALSTALYGLLEEKIHNSFWAKLVDVIGAIATVGGLSTALGLGIISLNYGAEVILGFSIGLSGKILIMLIIIGIYIISTMTGIQKGMTYLSNANILIAIFWCTFVLSNGETNTLMRLLVNTIGDYFHKLIPMSFYTDPHNNSSWISNWTIFYWLVVISWAPFVGGFIARISKGRTIREYIIGAVIIPSSFGLVWFTIIGGQSVLLELKGIAPMWDIVSKDVGGGVYTLLKTMPYSYFMTVLVFINMLLFLVTSADSGSFFLAMLMSNGAYEPKTAMKVLWGSFLGLLALVLLISGGLQALQAATIIAGTPFAIVIVFMLWALIRTLQSEYEKECGMMC